MESIRFLQRPVLESRSDKSSSSGDAPVTSSAHRRIMTAEPGDSSLPASLGRGRPDCREKSVKIRRHRLWMVLMSGAFGNRSPNSSENRRPMSPADSREKERQQIRSGAAPRSKRAASRATSTVVLPEPGTASSRVGVLPVVRAWAWTGLNRMPFSSKCRRSSMARPPFRLFFHTIIPCFSAGNKRREALACLRKNILESYGDDTNKNPC